MSDDHSSADSASGAQPCTAGGVPDDRAETVSTMTEQAQRAKELGGPKGPEPTRYGDWERNGRCSDF